LFLVVLGFELRASAVAKQTLLSLDTLCLPFFALGIFEIRSFYFCLGTAILLISAS
jgi:hypothetical protein